MSYYSKNCPGNPDPAGSGTKDRDLNKNRMKTVLNVFVVALILASCKGKSTAKRFEVNGTITNSPETLIYLEEIPMTTMQRIRVDSAVIGKDGKFSLKGKANEPTVYTLRIGNNEGPPLAAVINDAPEITVNASFASGN